MAFIPTSAFVLAAGLGTRMRPLTDTLPKPLIKLQGRALIDHVLDRLDEAGIRQAIVNVHYKASLIEQHLARRSSPRITISDERGLLLDTGGGVVHALALLGHKAFLIHNSDSVWLENDTSNLPRLFSDWDEARMDCLALLADRKTSLGYDGRGDFDLDEAGRLQRRPKGRDADYVFAGVSIAHPRLFAGAPSGPFSLNAVWDRAIQTGRMFGVTLEGTWMHVGTPEALAEADALVAKANA